MSQFYPLSQNALAVLRRRYFAPGENWQMLCERVAKNLAEAEQLYGQEPAWAQEEFFDVMHKRLFLPNSPTLMNAGRELQQLSACFVLPVDDDLSSIFDQVKNAALIHKSGGGTGFAFSRLRPRGSRVGSTNGVASGPVSFIGVFDGATEGIKQGGTRRGANMAVLSVYHPDILEFVESKISGDKLTNFNISVGVDAAFIEAALNGKTIGLLDPTSKETVGTISAHGLWNRIAEAAHATGDPGLVFLDRVNEDHPNRHLGRIESTNPCGEQPLLPYESCNLGSVNLARCLKMYENDVAFDWDELKRAINIGVRMLDNVIDMNNYPLPEIEAATKDTRRIGLGVMGWAEALLDLRIPYGSPAARELADKLSRYINTQTLGASAYLASIRGSYPQFHGSYYAQNGWEHMRNTAPYTIAPTGTISIIADTTSGIEPLYALAFERRVMDGERLTEVNPSLVRRAKTEGWWQEGETTEGLLAGMPLSALGATEETQLIFQTAHEICPHHHLQMQAAWQKYVPNAVSKTINLPAETTVEQVKDIYIEAYEAGCKGITIFRDGSKGEQVLVAPQAAQQAPAPKKTKSSRPVRLEGSTERVDTAHGQLYVTVNRDPGGSPFELFVAQGKVHNCDKANLEALGKLISLSLRAGISAEEVVTQLRGISCCPVWSGRRQTLSVPDALAQVLAGEPVTLPPEAAIPELYRGCPECSQASVVMQEGCLVCRSCGWSRC